MKRREGVSAERDALQVELYAWVGEDEYGSGEIGLKQALVPAGRIPMVATSEDKMRNVLEQMHVQSAMCGKKICLVRFVAAEVVCSTEHGK